MFEELKNLPRFCGMAHVSNTDYQHVMVSVRNKSGDKAIPKMYKMGKKLDIFLSKMYLLNVRCKNIKT